MTDDHQIAELDAEQLLQRWLALHTAPTDAPPAAKDRPDALPTSYEQQGMWFAQQLRGRDNASYVVRHAYAIDGPLDTAALSGAWRDLVRRHAPLRTTFALVDGRVTQVVRDQPPGDPTVEEADADTLPDRLDAAFREPFDLAEGPVVRLRLFRLAPRRHVLFLVIHHIANDGWSMDVLHRELAALYAERTGGPAAALAPLPVEYADLAIAQRERWTGAGEAAAIAYWTERLRDAPTLFTRPATRARASYRGTRLEVPIPAGTHAGVARLAAAEHASPFMVLLAALGAVLARWTGQRDMVLGAAVANRDTPESEALIGCFAGVLPLRVRMRPETGFTGLLRDVRTALLEGEEHRMPYERLLEELEVGPETAMSPLFDTVVASHQGFGTPLTLAGATVTYLPPEGLDCPQDLTVYLTTTGDGATVHVDYARDAFEPSAVEAVFDAYLALLGAAVERPDSPVDDLGPALARRVPPAPEPATDTRPDPATDTRPEPGGTSGARSTAEEVTAAVWREVLGHPVTGDDNFFLLGGTSVAALRTATALAERLGVAEIPLRLIYEYSDLAEFAEQLSLLLAADAGA